MEDGGCLGVHSTEIDTESGPVAAADLPRDDPEHAPFLSYYRAMEIPEDFYWFTLEVASPKGIHYLTPGELGHCDAALVDAGVSKPARTGNLIDVFADRVTFPLAGTYGEVSGFTGRAITTGEQTPKYLNSSANQVFNKSETSYGTNAIGPATRSVVITEGPWDAAAVTCETSGRHVGVAASGTAFTYSRAQQLAATGRPVTVWMDPDQAGQDAAVRAHGKLATAGVHDARYTTTAVLDPSAFHEAAGAAQVQAAVTSRTIPLTK